MMKLTPFLVLALLLTFQVAIAQTEGNKASRDTTKLVAREKALEFTSYTFEILNLRDKDSDPAYKQLRITFKSPAPLPPVIVWKLNNTQGLELMSYLKKFDELIETEKSKSAAGTLVNIGRIENTDLFFQLTPVGSTYLKVVDRISPENNSRINNVDLQALRRILVEFIDSDRS